MGNPGSLSISAGMYGRPALTSPMAQLTCLLPSKSTENLSHIGTKVPPSVQSTPTPPSSKYRINMKNKEFFIKKSYLFFLEKREILKL